MLTYATLITCNSLERMVLTALERKLGFKTLLLDVNHPIPNPFVVPIFSTKGGFKGGKFLSTSHHRYEHRGIVIPDYAVEARFAIAINARHEVYSFKNQKYDNLIKGLALIDQHLSAQIEDPSKITELPRIMPAWQIREVERLQKKTGTGW